jgi:MOSC domain-containing protein YiiM
MDIDKWVKRFMAERMPGTYFQVLELGTITAGDEIEIVATPEHGVTVCDVFQLVAGDRDADRLARVIACPDLPREMHVQVSGYLK